MLYSVAIDIDALRHGNRIIYARSEKLLFGESNAPSINKSHRKILILRSEFWGRKSLEIIGWMFKSQT